MKMRRIVVYSMLLLGSGVFAWPFVWMIATSAKLERELFTNRTGILPERPNPRTTSPYIDEHVFAAASGPRRNEATAVIEEQLQNYSFPANVDPELTRKQVARGVYQHLLGSI